MKYHHKSRIDSISFVIDLSNGIHWLWPTRIILSSCLSPFLRGSHTFACFYIVFRCSLFIYNFEMCIDLSKFFSLALVENTGLAARNENFAGYRMAKFSKSKPSMWKIRGSVQFNAFSLFGKADVPRIKICFFICFTPFGKWKQLDGARVKSEKNDWMRVSICRADSFSLSHTL